MQFCFTSMSWSQAQAGLNEGCWHSCSQRNTQQCFCQWTRAGRPLPACWLRLLGWRRQRPQKNGSSLPPLFWPPKQSGREIAGKGRRRQAAPSKLRTGIAATPSVLLWVSCSHAGYESEWISKGWGCIFTNGRETTVARAEFPIETWTVWGGFANTFTVITRHTVMWSGFQVQNLVQSIETDLK